MKVCPNCGSSFDDSMKFCVQCGTELVEAPEEQPIATAQEPVAEQPAPEAAPQPEYQQPEYQQPYGAPVGGYAPVYQEPVDPDDHTAEFSAEDIENNKLYAMLGYILGGIGIIIALLAGKDSEYVKFHTKQAIKFLVVEWILIFATAILGFTIVLGIAGGVCLTIVAILEIIAFVQVCKGQAKEPAIIKKLKFLK